MVKQGDPVQLLQELPFFSGLPVKVLDALIAVAHIVSYPKGHHLFFQGDEASRFFIILDGWVKLHRETVEGDEAVVAMLTYGDTFGEAAIFNGSIYPFSAEVSEAATIADIPARILKEQAQISPELTAKIMGVLSKGIQKSQLENEHLAVMSAPQRVGCLLLQLSGHMIGKGGTFSFPYDKSLAAAQLGMKPETFSRALSQLKSYGVSVIGPEIKIESFSCLVGYCCGHCSAQPGECPGSHGGTCGGGACKGREIKTKLEATK